MNVRVHNQYVWPVQWVPYGAPTTVVSTLSPLEWVAPDNALANTAYHGGHNRSSMGQARRNRGAGSRGSGRGRQGWSQADANGRFNRQPSWRRYNSLQRQRQRRRQREQRQRNRAPSIRNGLVPAESQPAGSGRAAGRSAVSLFPKLQAPADTRGVDYEERNLALAFLRCLRYNFKFYLSSNNEGAGKFDDLVLRWQRGNSADTYLLLAQLKHKSPTHGSSEITRAMLLQTSGFSVAMYQESYHHIKNELQTPNFTLLVSTNAPLACDTRGMIVSRSPASVPGAEFLDTGGKLYGLNPDNKEVRRAVNNDHRFIEHFAIFCQQKDSEEIEFAIRKEIETLLGSSQAGIYVYERLGREIRDWKLNENFWLTESWKKWTDIVYDYTEKYLCQCGDKTVRPPIVFNGVDNMRKFVSAHNPAQITPLRRSTMALTVSKIHQAVRSETNILLGARRYRQLRQQVLCLWGRFCKWLVVLDDGPEDDTEVFEELSSHLKPSRRLVFVTSKKESSFLDSFGSSEVSDECWRRFMDIRIRLNGNNHLCRLRDIVGDAGSLKTLLDSKPEDVLTLSLLPSTVDMGQQLDTVPDYYISRRVVRRCVTQDFFSSLGEKDVCIMSRNSYSFLPDWARKDVSLGLRKLETELGSTNIKWPLLTITSDADRSAVEQICGRHPDVCFYLLKYSAGEWEILFFSCHRDRIQPYIKIREIQSPEVLDLSRARVILEGAPGIGKSTMLAAAARHRKAIDPAYWIVRVNFSEFYNIFDNCDNSEDAVEQVLMHVTSSEDQLGHLERTLLRNCLRHSPRVICLVDGFDELTSNYTDLWLQILKHLAPSEGGLLVTARPTANKLLEETLGSMACLLTPFSDAELQTFLRMYRHLSVDSITTIIANVPKPLLRLPLFCKMSADLEDRSVADAAELCNAFFQRECERLWMKKQGAYPAAVGGKQEFEEQWKSYEEHLMFLAVSFLVQRKGRVGQRSYHPINKDIFVEAGIMRKSADGSLVFVHRMFAEYFLTKWCLANIKQQECADLYREALLGKNLEFFMWTFDLMASKGHKLFELIMGGSESNVVKLLNSSRYVVEVDEAGRNAMHLATVYSESWTVVQRLCARGTPSVLGAKDDLLHWTPLRYAVELGRWPAVAALLKAGAKPKQLGDFQAGKRDYSELKNWLPKATFKKFIEHIGCGKNTHSGLQSNNSQGTASITTSPTTRMSPNNYSQPNIQYWINTFSVLQRDGQQTAIETGKSFQAGMRSGKNWQTNDQHEKGADSGPKTDEQPNTKKAATSSHKVIDPLNSPQPQVHRVKNKENVLLPNQGQSAVKTRTTSRLATEVSDDPQTQRQGDKSTVTGPQSKENPTTEKSALYSEMKMVPSNDPQPHISRGRSTDSSQQSNVGKTTATTAPHVEVGTDQSKSFSQESCCQCCCQFSLLAALRAVCCLSESCVCQQ